MPDTYTPVLTDVQIGALVCEVYKKTASAEIGELRLRQDAIALGRAIERAAIETYQRRHAAESLLLGKILAAWHNDGETGDVDGAWLQDAVIASDLAVQGDEGYVLTNRAMELIGMSGLPTSSVENQAHNRMTDPRQQDPARGSGDQIEE